MTIIYGITTDQYEHIDTSKTMQGAKRYATINGYKKVSMRDHNHYYVTVCSVKKGGVWFDTLNASNILNARIK
jgi:hypothetical protein